MRPQYRQLKHLYFQFIKGTDLDGILDWHDVANCFVLGGLIQLVPDRTGVAQYKGYLETEYMREIPADRFHSAIYKTLREYAKSVNKEVGP